MEWQDTGLVLSTRKHSETSVIVELLTEGRGRHLGLLRGGRSRKYRAMLQPGNRVAARWNARLPEHMGLYRLEPLRQRAARIMELPPNLLALQSICALLQVLAEREPHERLYLATDLLFERLQEERGWQAMLVHWELRLLAELGFGLDLSECAATGSRDNLLYVSPRSGKAVSSAAAAPYLDKMLPLPAFVQAHEVEAEIGRESFADGLALSGHFLEKRWFASLERAFPDVRHRLFERVQR